MPATVFQAAVLAHIKDKLGGYANGVQTLLYEGRDALLSVFSSSTSEDPSVTQRKKALARVFCNFADQMSEKELSNEEFAQVVQTFITNAESLLANAQLFASTFTTEAIATLEHDRQALVTKILQSKPPVSEDRQSGNESETNLARHEARLEQKIEHVRNYTDRLQKIYTKYQYRGTNLADIPNVYAHTDPAVVFIKMLCDYLELNESRLTASKTPPAQSGYASGALQLFSRVKNAFNSAKLAVLKKEEAASTIDVLQGCQVLDTSSPTEMRTKVLDQLHQLNGRLQNHNQSETATYRVPLWGGVSIPVTVGPGSGDFSKMVADAIRKLQSQTMMMDLFAAGTAAPKPSAPRTSATPTGNNLPTSSGQRNAPQPSASAQQSSTAMPITHLHVAKVKTRPIELSLWADDVKPEQRAQPFAASRPNDDDDEEEAKTPRSKHSRSSSFSG